ncbi:MAG: peptidase ClpP [Acidimicrobiia bacterium]|nr:MAG: peptidase ClpP [Acidimicrobiia bacterium]
MSLEGRRILLGVSGGVAAYKSAHLARLFVTGGADVRVVMTPAATRFVGTPTFAAITGTHPVVDLLDDPLRVSPHTELARWAEVMVVAPATAATMSRIVHGLSEDALSATALAFTGPLIVAPAMHTEMWEHPATRRVVDALRADGVELVGPGVGPLAGGDEGPGRMAEPEEIHSVVEAILAGSLSGLRVLVTAGGTREPIDPVRYVGNRSSGKMGHAIAEEAARRGAEVVLVTTSDLPVRTPGITRVQVETAEEMAEAVARVDADVAVMAAAVADFRPRDPAAAKLARSDGPPTVELEPTRDILAEVAARSHRPYLVGFAAETGDLDRAVEKARTKGVDLLVANDVSQPGSGFGVDTNRVRIVRPDGQTEDWPLLTKTEVARRLWDLISEQVDPGA